MKKYLLLAAVIAASMWVGSTLTRMSYIPVPDTVPTVKTEKNITKEKPINGETTDTKENISGDTENVSVYMSAEDAGSANGASELQAENNTTKKPDAGEFVYRVSFGRADDVKILLERGASPDEVDKNGTPVIALATERVDNQALKIVEMLLEAGADINKTDARGQNALFYAARAGNKEIAEYLLSQNIRHNASDDAGNSPRVVAYQTGHNNIVELLDNFVRTENEKTSKKYAEVNKQLEERYNTIVQDHVKKTVGSEIDILKKLVRDASFASCAASYWRFCKDNNQPTELTGEQLESNITSYSGHVREFAGALGVEHQMDINSIKSIISVSEQKIKSQLSMFSSNEIRKQNGVGTISDMTSRCNSITQMFDMVNESEANKTGAGRYGTNPNSPWQRYGTPSPWGGHNPYQQKDWGDNSGGNDKRVIIRENQ